MAKGAHYRNPRPKVNCGVNGETGIWHFPGTFQPEDRDQPGASGPRGCCLRVKLPDRVAGVVAAPILPYYRARGILRAVDGMAEIDEVGRQIAALVGRK